MIKFELNWSSGFRGEDVEKVDRRTDARVTGILLAHPRAFASGELIMGDNGTYDICVEVLIKATIRPQNILRITNDIGMYMEKITLEIIQIFICPAAWGSPKYKQMIGFLEP